MDIRKGEDFSVDGLRFHCVGKPRVSPRDTKVVYVSARKWGITRLTIPVERGKSEVLVAR